MRALPILALVCLSLTHGLWGSNTQLNVLFIVTDDLNTNLATYQHPLVQTPELDVLATQSLRFDRAYCQWPVCGPSRASFLTGLYPNQTGVKDLKTSIRETIPDAVSLPQYFIQNGYQVARVGKLYHMNNPNGIGEDGEDDPQSWQERFNPVGVDESTEVRSEINILKDDGSGWKSGAWASTGARLSYLDAEGLTAGGVDKGDPLNHTDGKVATKAIDLIAEYSANDSPFLLAVGFFKPHTPFVAPKQYFDLYDPTDIVIPSVPEDYFDMLPAGAAATLTRWSQQNNLDPEIACQTILAYYATISFLDAQVGRVLAALDDPNGDGDTEDSIRDNTIIVFLSDHGYHMGEHDHYQKQTLFEDATRAPLMIAVPGMSTAGQSTESLAEFTDIYKTLASLTGLEEPADVEGVDLSTVIENASNTARDSALSQIDNNYSIRTERYRYTRWGNGGAGNIELYDHLGDPEELENLAYTAPQDHAGIIEELNALLDQRIAETMQVPEVSFPGTVHSTPFGGAALTIPGRIEAEDYDQGGQSIAYYDTNSGSSLPGGDFRNDDVDIALCADTGGGYNIGGLEGGEWLAYTVDVTAGVYDIKLRLASNNSGDLADLEIYLDGERLASAPASGTGGWQNWQTFTLSNVEVSPGGDGLKLVLYRSIVGEKFNFNWIEFELKSTEYSLWKSRYNWGGTFTGFEDDKDADGIANGLEYALGTHPMNGGSLPVVSMTRQASTANINYGRQAYATDLAITPEWSSDLITWHQTGFTEQVLSYDSTMEVVQASLMVEETEPCLFMRLSVSGASE